jgi:hypothetical protein
METKFLTMDGEMIISLRRRGLELVGMAVAAECVIGSCAPFPTVIEV